MLNNQLLQLRDLSTFLMLLAVSHVCRSVRVCVCVRVRVVVLLHFLAQVTWPEICNSNAESVKVSLMSVRVCACLMSPVETAYSVSANVLIISL